MAIKTVTLARPHPAIVGDMVPFLEKLGIEVEQITRLEQLQYELTLTTDAVVISLAVTSTVRATVERVLSEVMRLNPNVLLIFSSELPLKKKQKNLFYMLSRYFENPCITDCDNECAPTYDGRCLYICGDDLKLEGRRQKVRDLIKRY
ncbi:hypothetical protein DEU29_102205 [Idiomarina aquatica]|uniref:Uncharacterized protein n=1 Tax=Idiomarina aquatica TaxID=1327752 RepID=A0A4R6PPL2_9GAMM|nr:hypothetical protein [Idiomarina aquatica]TDP40305.1 hypothetical protein DEU29_102205 [Idiomarina aquatica]